MFLEWVLKEVKEAATELTDEEATSLLPVALTTSPRGRKRQDRLIKR
jgi:hypothetical protein